MARSNDTPLIREQRAYRIKRERVAMQIIHRDGRSTGTIPVIPVARALDVSEGIAAGLARRLQASGRVPADWRLDWSGSHAYAREWQAAGGRCAALERRVARGLAELDIAGPVRTGMPTPEQLAAAWIDYALKCGRQIERRFPGIDGEQIAIDALVDAIRRNRGGPFLKTFRLYLRGAMSEDRKYSRSRKRAGTKRLTDEQRDSLACPWSAGEIAAVDAAMDAPWVLSRLPPEVIDAVRRRADGDEWLEIARDRGQNRGTPREQVARARKWLRSER